MGLMITIGHFQIGYLLQIIKQNEEIISNIKIINKNYVSKLNGFEGDDDVLH